MDCQSQPSNMITCRRKQRTFYYYNLDFKAYEVE
jgi:hypothetical protein